MRKEKAMADATNLELQRRIEELENKSNIMQSKFETLENQVQTISQFISAITAAQNIDQTMDEIENVTKQLTQCEKATFYCYDRTADKFFSHDDYRTWQDDKSAEEIKRVFESKEVLSDSKKAVIPLVSVREKSMGVIVAEKESGFTQDDYDKLRPGGQVANTVELALSEEFQHQGRLVDELTELKNRQGLNEYLENTLCGNINRGMDASIILVDIDNFKKVNDTYGHGAGDVVLKGVADVLKEATRAGADCAFRTGGEEMVCILHCPPEMAVKTAEQIRQKIQDTIYDVIDKSKCPAKVNVTLSVGLHHMKPVREMTPTNAREVFDNELINADFAVYHAKETGKNKVVTFDDNILLSYLASRAAEMLCGENKANIAEMKSQIEEMLIKDNDYETVIEALQALAEEHPELLEESEKIITRLGDFFQGEIPETEKIEEIETEENTMSNYGSKAPKFYNKEAFKDIQNKEYIRTDAATAFKIAQRAMEENVEFSAKYDGERSAVTVDGVRDRAFVEAMREEFNIPESSRSEGQYDKHAQNYRREAASQEHQPAYFGHGERRQTQENSPKYYNREGFKDIQNKEYVRTDSKTAYAISQEAQKFGIDHSVKYDGEKSTVTLDGVKDKAFVDAVRQEFNIPENSRPKREAEKPSYFGHNTAAQENRNSYPSRNNNPQSKEASYFNREGFKDIRNKTYIRTDSKTAYAISKAATKRGVEHSAKYDGVNSAVTVDGVRNRDFVDAVKKMAAWAEKVQIKEAQNQNRAKSGGAR